MEHLKDTPLDNPVNIALKLPTAKAFDSELNALLAANEAVVLAMVDMDNFMRVNTSFGREEGDRVLIEVGRYLAGGAPKDARLYRYGGDAFAILFPGGYEKEDVFLLMEKLRAGMSVVLPNGENMTITAGIASAPEDATLYGELVRKAEGAMTRGKRTGHNKVCLAREEKMVVKTTHYTSDQLHRLAKLSKREGTNDSILLREALDGLLKKYDV